jgi:polyketide biosynthesis acyl carrier protein
VYAAGHPLARLLEAARAEGLDGPLLDITLGSPFDAAELATVQSTRDEDGAMLRLLAADGAVRAQARAEPAAFPPPPDIERGLIEGGAVRRLAPALDDPQGWVFDRLLNEPPTAIARLASFGPLTGELVVWAIADAGRSTAASTIQDMLVARPDGRVVLELRGVATMAAAPAAAPPPVNGTACPARNGAAHPAASPSSRVRDIVEAQIRAVLPALPANAIRPGIALADLGANSIDRAEVAAGAMEALDLALPPGELAAVMDVDGLVDLLARHLARRPLNGSGAPHAG